MTQRLYLDDAYLRACDATVVRAEGSKVVLDRTVLYAESGGQAPDHGVLRWDGREARVVDSQVEGGGHVGDVAHALEGEAPASGTRVQVEVDWPRRHGLMRHHTAAHLIAAVLQRDFRGAKFTGGQLYPDRARIDVHFDAWDPEIPKRVGEAANAEAQKGYAVKNYEITREEFAKGDWLRTAENLLDPAIERVRITDIVGLDAQADGGTHVRDTREVGRIVMEKADNKGKGHRRLSFRCE
ncbi:MAG TPA: alanyl-tRNA editing protein [Candidatus Thermoplasmatota archaeon]|nr:alanyl-tRNA editing protein [Candidatus Thermoplasmatota archaeon]